MSKANVKVDERMGSGTLAHGLDCCKSSFVSIQVQFDVQGAERFKCPSGRWSEVGHSLTHIHTHTHTHTHTHPKGRACCERREG